MARIKEFDYNEKLEEARNLFWEKGYNVTSMNDIVERLQLNRSSIYATFGNKRDLFIECLQNYAKLKTAQYIAASNQVAKTPFDKLSKMVHSIILQTIKDNKTCLIVRSISELSSSDREIKNLIIQNGVVLHNLLNELIDKSKESGELKKDLSTPTLSNFILSSFSGIYEHYMLSKNIQEVKDMINLMLSSFRA